MTIAVYSVPPSPSNEKGANAANDLSEFKGNSTNVVISKMTFRRTWKNDGKAKVRARAENVSPMMMEYASDAKKHLAVMAPEMAHAELGPTLFDHTSLKVVELCFSHALPMMLNVYADSKPITVKIAVAGSNANGESEKNATPDGNDKTPAPMMLLARLNVDVVTVASPPLALDTEDCATIDTSLDAAPEALSNKRRRVAVTVPLLGNAVNPAACEAITTSDTNAAAFLMFRYLSSVDFFFQIFSCGEIVNSSLSRSLSDFTE